MDTLTDALLWFAAISVGLMAGIYFTFSAFVMKSLGAIDAPAGMIAMRSINRVIVKSTFLPIFFASTFACMALASLAVFDIGATGARWSLAGGLTYFIGMFVVTVTCNVPLNNRLEASQPYDPQAPETWRIYLLVWTRWNHVRTIASTVSFALLIFAIAQRN